MLPTKPPPAARSSPSRASSKRWWRRPGASDGRPLVAFLQAREAERHPGAGRRQRLRGGAAAPAEPDRRSTTICRPRAASSCVERLKANTRTHFLPADPDHRRRQPASSASGRWPRAPTPSSRRTIDEQERRTRLWALLRSQALYRRQEHKRETQRLGDQRARAAGSATSCTTCRTRWGRCRPTSSSWASTRRSGQPDERDPRTCPTASARPARLLQQLARGLRTVQDYERFECGRVALHAGAAGPGRAAARGEGGAGLAAERRRAGPSRSTSAPGADADRRSGSAAAGAGHPGGATCCDSRAPRVLKLQIQQAACPAGDAAAGPGQRRRAHPARRTDSGCSSPTSACPAGRPWPMAWGWRWPGPSSICTAGRCR